jgi:hypothetical protein
MSQMQPAKPYNPYAVKEVPSASGGLGLRKFENPKTQAALDLGLAELGPNETVAAVAHHVYDQHGDRITNETKLSIVVRLPAGFSIMAGAYKDWVSGDQGVEGKLAFSR